MRTVVMVCAVAAAAATASAKELSFICVEAKTGLVLAEQNADLVRPPASMIKMVQILLVAEGLQAGKWSLNTVLPVSNHAQYMGGTQVYLAAGETWSLGKLMEAVAVASANDAAMAVAEGLWGSEEAYLAAANKRVQELGMADTVINSVHGLPPDRGEDADETTARDMARLARECVKYPFILEWTRKTRIRFKPEMAMYLSTNKLLGKVPGLDGLKTGYIRAAGHCVTLTAQRDGIRLVAVVMGHRSGRERFAIAEELLENGFRDVRREQVFARGDARWGAVGIVNSETPALQPVAASDVWVTYRDGERDNMRQIIKLPDEIPAPVRLGQVVGSVEVALGDNILGRTELIAPQNVDTAGWLWQLRYSLVGN